MRAALVLASICVAAAVTPIEKVIGLLKDLEAKVESAGAKEAAQYDKYACFCKNQAEFKDKAIKKEKEQIEIHDADIADLKAKIAELNDEIKAADKKAKDSQDSIDTKTTAREKANKIYVAKEADLADAISACGEALDALKAAKGAMKNADVDLLQLKTTAATFKLEQTPEAMSEALSLVKTASKAARDADGRAEVAQPAFKSQSNDIIATIEGLEETFKSNKKDLFDAEHEAAATFDSEVLDLTNIRNFAEKESKEKSTLSEEKAGEQSDSEDAQTMETENKASDTAFLTQLKSDCKQKAADWDQRSKARSEEMAALAEATATLQAGAATQYGANKKLVGLVQKAAPSFLQRRSVGGSKVAVLKNVLSSLDTAASRLGSPVIAAIALKVQLGEDHFSNVRALIKDLITKLKDDAKAEATTKKFCDTQMKKATGNRDTASENIEKESGIISKKESLAAEKAQEIEDLANDIAELNKAILEQTELRTAEKANNAETVEESKAGSKAVASALTVLQGFYGLIQYKPPKSDKYGQTVADAAPDSFSGEYKGSGDEAKGILGILEVIKSDFDRTVTTVEKAEAAAVKDFDASIKTMKSDISDKTTDKGDAKTAKETAESAVVSAKDNLHDANTLKDSAEAELEKLSPMCVEGTETYAERVQKRNDEIEALKEAMKILDEWQA